jgi:hypothetical protein
MVTIIFRMVQGQEQKYAIARDRVEELEEGGAPLTPHPHRVQRNNVPSPISLTLKHKYKHATRGIKEAC